MVKVAYPATCVLVEQEMASASGLRKLVIDCLGWLKMCATDSKYFDAVALSLLIGEVIMLVSIIKFVPYTEIDWIAYMQEVEGVLNGTYDYAHLKGDTGPLVLVYPAGFVYVFALLYHLTSNGSDVLTAQWFFAGIYLLNLVTVLAIYRRLFKAEMYPPYLVLFLGCTAYRIHSIYVLRLFNDPIAMFLLYLAVLLILDHRWMFGSVVYSLAVSVKMNVLLFSPGLLVVFLMFLGWRGTLFQLAVCVLIQAVVGAPFILNNPLSYFNGAFNFGRVFLYKWTVNWRMLPEWVFLHRGFHIALLFLHIVVLFTFAVKHWTKYSGLKQLAKWRATGRPNVSKRDIAWILFTANLIGMMFSRSLHYQFYVWYFHSLPFLLWSTALPPFIRIGLLLVLEWAWNVYPSTVLSSLALHAAHFTILVGLYRIQPARKLVARKEL